MHRLKESNWDAVKFQKRSVRQNGDGFYSQEFLKTGRDSPWGKTQRDQKEGLEFSATDYKTLHHAAVREDIMWYASPWDVPSVEFLEGMGVPCYKIASLTARAFPDVLNEVAVTGKPIIVSTGMMTRRDIDRVVNTLSSNRLILLHCVGLYPCPAERVHLEMIPILQDAYPDIPVGYSGHETSLIPSIMAACLGACMIERHVTLDRNMYGSDQHASLDPGQFGLLADVLRMEGVPFLKDMFASIGVSAKCRVGDMVEGERQVYLKLLGQSSLNSLEVQ